MGLVDGERKLFWNNGGIKQVSQFKSGVLFGESKFYFSKSNLRKLISFDNYGNRDGEWLDYYSNGNLKQKVVYKSGKILDSLKKYSINGDLIK